MMSRNVQPATKLENWGSLWLVVSHPPPSNSSLNQRCVTKKVRLLVWSVYSPTEKKRGTPFHHSVMRKLKSSGSRVVRPWR